MQGMNKEGEAKYKRPTFFFEADEKLAQVGLAAPN